MLRCGYPHTYGPWNILFVVILGPRLSGGSHSHVFLRIKGNKMGKVPVHVQAVKYHCSDGSLKLFKFIF